MTRPIGEELLRQMIVNNRMPRPKKKPRRWIAPRLFFALLLGALVLLAYAGH